MNVTEFFRQLEAENPELEAAGAEIDPPHFLASNVYDLRTARGMTQAALAKAIGIAQPRIAEIERGEANPRLSTIGRLARALDTAVSELLRVPAWHSASRESRGNADSGAAERRRVG